MNWLMETVGSAVGKKLLMAGTGSGDLRIRELQAPGAKRMHTEEFLRGHEIKSGSWFL